MAEIAYYLYIYWIAKETCISRHNNLNLINRINKWHFIFLLISSTHINYVFEAQICIMFRFLSISDIQMNFRSILYPFYSVSIFRQFQVSGVSYIRWYHYHGRAQSKRVSNTWQPPPFVVSSSCLQALPPVFCEHVCALIMYDLQFVSLSHRFNIEKSN